MTDNLTPRFALPTFELLRLQGVDAEAFAQSQFANDVTALAVGQWQWSCWLNAKGRVMDVFALARLEAGDLLLILPDGGAVALGQALQRLVFRRKVTFALDPRPVSGCLTTAGPATGNQLAATGSDSLCLDWGSASLPRQLHIGDNATIAQDPQAASDWQQTDLRLGLPRLAADQRQAWTAQQLGLDRLSAYSVRKGCYPGQEIVARTHFLSKAKRATVLLHGIAAGTAAGTPVLAADAEIGRLACVAAPWALAVLPLERELVSLQAGGKNVQAQSLVDGLQR